MFVNISVAAYGGKDGKTFCYETSDALQAGQIVKLKFAGKDSIGVVRSTNVKRPAGVKRFEKASPLKLQNLPSELMPLADWMIDYYATTASSVWQLILPKNPTTLPRKTFTTAVTSPQPLNKLQPQQVKALNKIRSSAKPVLLEGVMGSGKTEIYFHLIKEVLGGNKSAILLLPEIFLTNQMILRARKHFGAKLLVTHSGMTVAERRAFWDKCNSMSASSGVIVIGPRSALFAPVNNLGLIIIDECHEQSYKQDAAPRYLTEHVAAKLAGLCGAKLVLGSATPSVTTRYLADAGKLTLIKLADRATAALAPVVTTIGPDKTGTILSDRLHSDIAKVLKNKKSAMLYVNRRGTTPLFICSDCGHAFICPICGLNLHLHADIMRLNCHGCGYSTVPPAACPECSSTNLRGVGVGTKAVESKIIDTFPEAKVFRIDRDSAKPDEYQAILDDLQKGKIDIVIGTQILGRGLDVAGLELVGIINADYDLLASDFNSSERAFQQISQTAGRAGRRDQQGEVIIQTTLVTHELLGFITNFDYEGFYQAELSKRKKYSYPPFSYLLKLECGFVNQSLGQTKCNELLKKLESNNSFEILGPAKAHPFTKSGKHYWKLVVKSKSRQKLIELARTLDANWIINLDPYGIT